MFNRLVNGVAADSVAAAVEVVAALAVVFVGGACKVVTALRNDIHEWTEAGAAAVKKNTSFRAGLGSSGRIAGIRH